MTSSLVDQIGTRGYAIVAGVLSPSRIERLLAAISAFDHTRSERRGETFGIRDVLGIAEFRELASDRAVMSLVAPIVGDKVRAVRGIFFDKTPGANWPVPWHQDLSVAVAEKRDIDGWTAWSIKNGIHHVQPPAAVLEQMLTVRLHLDDCGPDNGPLRVRPGTHAMGRLLRDAINSALARTVEETCCAEEGDALIMRPLLLHASSAATNPSHRRVIHLEYAPPDLLPGDLDWAFQ